MRRIGPVPVFASCGTSPPYFLLTEIRIRILLSDKIISSIEPTFECILKFPAGKELSWNRFSETIKKYRSYIITGSLVIIAILIISIIAPLAISSSYCKVNSTSIPTPPLDNITSLKHLLEVHIGRLNYAPGQIVDISGTIFNSTTGNNTNTKSILITNVSQIAGQSVPWCYLDLQEPKITHFVSIPTTNKGTFNYSGLRNEDIGKYVITIYPLNEPQSTYSFPIEVVNPFFTLTAHLLYAGIIFFALLMIATIVPSKREAKEEREKREAKEEREKREAKEKVAKIKWTEVSQKHVRTTDDVDIGKVEKVGNEFIVVRQGSAKEHPYYIPKACIINYDGSSLYINVPINFLRKKFEMEKEPTSEEIQALAKEVKEEEERREAKNLTTYKILRFIFISGMVISILGGLMLTDVEVGPNSPVGLILTQVFDTNGKPRFDENSGLPIREWVIDIGGNIPGNDRTFVINVPFYVVLLGLLGGYLRYLSKAASKVYVRRESEHSKAASKVYARESDDEKNSQDFAVGTEAELSEIALAPLLAIVVWLLLSQGQTTANIYWLAAVSFSVGLITKEIIDSIKRLMTRISLNATDRSST